MPKIVIKIPGGNQVTHELSGASITIGRSADSTIILDEASISGGHAEFVESKGTYLLRDLDSTNGTFVNGEPASDTPLKHGDTIAFGSVLATFEFDTAPPAREEEEAAMNIHEAEEITATIGDSSERPSDFTSISPFPKKRKRMDPLAAAVLALGVLSILASAGLALFATIMKAA